VLNVCVTGIFDGSGNPVTNGGSVVFGSEASPPRAGDKVGPETVTMSGADGTTAFPFADNSLVVWVDATDQTAAITAQDGAAGTFTLGFTPYRGELVQVHYVAR
jgi:hypothetical protein